MLDVIDRFFQKHADVGVMQGVDDRSSLPVADHEPKVAQDAELMRDRGLPHTDGLREV
jgi:hypothetical protein